MFNQLANKTSPPESPARRFPEEYGQQAQEVARKGVTFEEQG